MLWTALLLAFAASHAAAQQPASGAGGRTDTMQVVALGEVEVVGRRETVAHRLGRSLSADDVAGTQRRDLSEALPLLTGATLQRVGPRNESGLRVRGFDLRHVPLFVDGIPVYVPYDGLVDLARFLTNDIERITLASGFSSLLYGPNALAGVVNVVTREPRERIEGRLETGWRSVGGREALLSLGTRRQRWFALGGLAYLNQDTYPLSDAYVPAPGEDGGRRENAARKDVRWSAKLGLVPAPGARYVVGFIDQRGEKGNPPYAGQADDIRIRYWRWPKWNKQSIYLLGDQAVGKVATVRGRLYYDRFESALYSYDDATYASQAKPFAFRNFSDDASYGAILQAAIHVPAGHRLGVAAQVKSDRHVERDAQNTLGRYRDATWSVSVEDEFPLGPRARVVAGLMVSRRNAREARSFLPDELFPESGRGAVDGHLALMADLHRGHEVYASLARRTRYPTIKDRYSFRQGRALPNPDLEAEQAVNGEIGYIGALADGVRIRSAVFWSEIEDVIQTGGVVDPDTGKQLAQLQNTGRARHLGAEVTLQVRTPSWVRGEAAYAYVRPENRTNPEFLFTHTPAHEGRAAIEASFWPGWSLGCSVLRGGSRFSRIEGTVLTELEGFTMLDVLLTVTPLDGLRIQAGLRNAGNAHYELVAGYPEPGRHAVLRGIYTFR